jgi:hypothetical protein
LFQIARDSGATLSECAFSLKKRTSLEKAHIKTRPLQGFTSKEPGMKEVFEFNHKILGGLSMQDPQGSPTI